MSDQRISIEYDDSQPILYRLQARRASLRNDDPDMHLITDTATVIVRLRDACKSLKSSWQCYLVAPDSIGVEIEAEIILAEEALKLFEGKQE